MRLEEQILKKGCLITGGEDAGGGNGTLLEGPSARNGRSEGGHEEGVEDDEEGEDGFEDDGAFDDADEGDHSMEPDDGIGWHDDALADERGRRSEQQQQQQEQQQQQHHR